MAISVSNTPEPRTVFDWYKLYLRAAFTAVADASAWREQAKAITWIEELSARSKETRIERFLKHAVAADGAAYGYAFRAAELLYDRA